MKGSSTFDTRSPFFIVRLYSSRFSVDIAIDTLVKLLFNLNTSKFMIFRDNIDIVIGLEINMGSKKLLTQFHIHFEPASDIQIEVKPFKGVNAGCLELERLRSFYLFSWGMSLPELMSRARASETKANLETATLLLLQESLGPIESEHNRSVRKEFVLERLLILLRDLGFPPCYSSVKGELNDSEYTILSWLIHHMLYRREGDAGPHLCIMGDTDYARFLIESLGSFFNLYITSPLMESFTGASKADIWLVEGCSSSVLTKRWALSEAGLNFEKLLRGEPVTFQWGKKGAFTYTHKGAVPIILLFEDHQVPIGLYHYRYSTLLVLLNLHYNYNGHKVLNYERMIASICRLGLNHLESYRQEMILFNNQNLEDYVLFRFYKKINFVWFKCDLDISSDLTFFLSSEEIQFLTDLKKELPGSFVRQMPKFFFSLTPSNYLLDVLNLRIRWLRAYLT